MIVHWVIIQECDNYSINNFSEVKRNSTGQIIKSKSNNFGYIFYTFYKDGIRIDIGLSILQKKYLKYLTQECVDDANGYIKFSNNNFLTYIQSHKKRNYTEEQIRNTLENKI